MSSRSKRKGKSSSYYPTQWSEWTWSEQYQRHYRSRLKGLDDWEYEYEQPEDVPRTFPPLDPTSEASPTIQYPSSSQSSGYTTAPLPSVDDITQELSQTALKQNSPLAWQNHIKTRDPHSDREEFDPHYKVHGGWAFKWGRIFKVLWAEPKGADGAGSAGNSGTESLTVRKGVKGEETFAKVRRFVVVKPMKGHCICLPILTYSGQGVNKRGVHADHHTIIYSGKKPVVFRGEREKGLTMRSIKVTPDNPRHRLDDASRLNYAKTYTVEYNVKVWFIGKISSDSEWQIRTDYNRVHPPLEIKGVRPPDTPDDTYEHAASATDYTTGGGYSASAGYYSGGSSGGTYNGGSYPTTATYDTYPSSSYGPSYGSHSSGSSYADYTASQQTPYGGEPGMGFNVDPGEDLRAPGDSDDTGDQKDGDRAGGQRKFQGY